MESELTSILQENGFSRFIAFPEVNLTHPGTESITSFLDSFKGDIEEHIGQASPDSQLLFHAVFEREKGRRYIAKVKGRPDNIIFATKGGSVSAEITNLAQRFANLAYNSDNSSIHLFNPELYKDQTNVDTIKDLSTAIREKKLTLVIQESKYGNNHRETEAREESAHYILALFCLLSAFDGSITLNDLKRNSRIIIDSNQVRINGRGDLSQFITHGAVIEDRFQLLDEEATGEAIDTQLLKLYETLDTPTTLIKVTRPRRTK